MPNIATILKEEIARISRKQSRSETEQLKKASAHYRSEIAQLKRRLQVLEAQIKRLGRMPSRGAGAAAAAASGDEDQKQILLRDKEFDFSFAFGDLGRFRVNAFHERGNLEVRASASNVPNRVVFGAPNTRQSSADFGRITGTGNGPRSIQLGARLSF